MAHQTVMLIAARPKRFTLQNSGLNDVLYVFGHALLFSRLFGPKDALYVSNAFHSWGGSWVEKSHRHPEAKEKSGDKKNTRGSTFVKVWGEVCSFQVTGPCAPKFSYRALSSALSLA